MRRSVSRSAVLVVVAALFVAACGEAAPQATTQFHAVGTDSIAFAPDEFTVPAGVEITVEFTSEPAVDHDFVIAAAAAHGMAGDAGHGDHAGDAHAMASGDLHVAHAEPGETVGASFIIVEPGTYEVYCSVPGHRQAGMVATLNVVADV